MRLTADARPGVACSPFSTQSRNPSTWPCLPPRAETAAARRTTTEIAELILLGGHPGAGILSSLRAARAATEAMRERLSTPVLCQGDDSDPRWWALPPMRRPPCSARCRAVAGVDVPGPSLSLRVLIDRIPFPRPDDPLLSARQRAVAARGNAASPPAAALLRHGPAGCYGASPIRAWLRCSI